MSGRHSLARFALFPALVAAATACHPAGNAGPLPTPPLQVSRGPDAGAVAFSAGSFVPIPASALAVTAGTITPSARASWLSVDAGGMRAFVGMERTSAAEVSFVYRGPSSSATPLANGELRRQIGLALRARDTCNLVYVMWHIEPTMGVFVSVKRNTGAKAHSECGAGGYLHVKPRVATPPAMIVRDVEHVLRAELAGDELGVFADGAAVWRGALPREAFEFDGPPGLRTDNGTFDFELRVPGTR